MKQCVACKNPARPDRQRCPRCLLVAKLRAAGLRVHLCYIEPWTRKGVERGRQKTVEEPRDRARDRVSYEDIEAYLRTRG